MNKRLIGAILAGAMLLPAGSVHAEAAKAKTPVMLQGEMPIEVLYNARKILFDVRPRIVEGTVLIPVRYVSEKLQASVAIEGRTVLVVKGDRTVKLTIGSREATINGKNVTLAQPAIVENGRTLVPIRVISEGLGVPVRWDEVARFVWVGNEDVPKMEDVAELVDINPFLPYYKGRELYLDIFESGKLATQAYMLDYSDFPFILNNSIYYRWDLTKDSNGASYIKSTTNQSGAMGTGLFYLASGNMFRNRPEIPGFREIIGEFRIHYYNIAFRTDLDSLGDTNWAKFTLKEAQYIGINSDRINSFPVLVKNPFK
ncbi:copper amine oxidase N-terminal domain-containing protein [Paenibacillus silvisoli]|uniref:copper amine oxidase N-terminal domain-containing protein n=1 Tax=Paenibacillus silvisoli TaxID=3110539 RepID=UPI002805622E|nr:copper amine oxidase N-terminal domain-containing protein [Paenibacillus silvisoli]